MRLLSQAPSSDCLFFGPQASLTFRKSRISATCSNPLTTSAIDPRPSQSRTRTGIIFDCLDTPTLRPAADPGEDDKKTSKVKKKRAKNEEYTMDTSRIPSPVFLSFFQRLISITIIMIITTHQPHACRVRRNHRLLRHSR